MDGDGAAPLAGRGADAAGELGEVVRLGQADPGFLPLAVPDEVVPFGDEVVHRAARGRAADHLPRVAEGHAAVHAAAALLAQRLLGAPEVHLLPVADALQRRTLVNGLAQVVEESGRLAHQFPLTRATSCAFSSKAAISASSGGSPLARIFACASSMRR